MGRVQIKQLNSYFHHFSRQIRATDLNYASHLDHTVVIRMIHDARADCFNKLGFSEKNLLPNSDIVSMVVSDLQAQYLNDGQIFEDLIIETDFIERTKCGFRMSHRIKAIDKYLGSVDMTQQQKQSHINGVPGGATFKNIALVEVGLVAVSPITKKAVPLPESFFKLIGLNSTLPVHPSSNNKL